MGALRFTHPTFFYKMAVEKLVENEEAVELLGKPISSGAPSGSFVTAGPSGKADFAFSVEGPKGKGMVYPKNLS